MKSAESFLIEAQIGQIRINPLPQGELDITFRIGRYSTTQTVLISTLTSNIHLSTQLTLTIDRPIHNQRCSIVLHTYRNSDRQVLAIAPITVPKDNNHTRKIYKLAQCGDKNAQMQVSLNITLINSQSEAIRRVSSNQLMQAYKQRNSTNIDYPANNNHEKTSKNINSNTIMKQKPSMKKNLEKEGNEQHESIEYKLASQQDTLQSVIQQVKRFRQEKQAYHQLYQIEKNKNQVANHFIDQLINKIVKKYPNLMQIIPNLNYPTPHNHRHKQTDQINHNKLQKAYQQLQQANRSMHRQIALYKKQLDQLKLRIGQDSPRSSSNHFNFKSRSKGNLLPKQLLDIGSPRSFSMHQYNMIPPPATARFSQRSIQLTEQEVKRWLSRSIEQRQQLRQLLSCLPPKSLIIQTPTINLSKLKTNINQSILNLLKRKTITKQLLLAHKVQLNRMIDEVMHVDL